MMQKGIMLHTVSKAAVILSAYILHFCLGKILSVAEYGVMGTIITLTNFYYLFLTNGVRQSISKSISLQIYRPQMILTKNLTIQMALGILLGIANYFIAPVIANVFGNPDLKIYFEVVSVLIPLTALYFALTGALNGMKLFWAEAIVMIIYPILRLSSIPLTYVFEGTKPLGIVWGFVTGSLVAAIFAIIFVASNIKKMKMPEQPKGLTLKHALSTSWHFITLFAGITVILNLDTFMLILLKGNEELTGYYTAVCNFSLVPYYLVSAVYLVILPYVTESFKKGDYKEIAQVLSKNLFYIIIGSLPIVLLIATSSRALLANFYNARYMVAAPALSILVFGIFMLSVFVVFTVSLNGMNQQKKSTLMTMILLGVDVVLLFLLIPRYEILGAAISTTTVSVSGVIWAFFVMKEQISDYKIFDDKMVKAIIIILVFGIVCLLIYSLIPFNNFFILFGSYIFVWGLLIFCLIKQKIIQLKDLTGFLSPSKTDLRDKNDRK